MKSDKKNRPSEVDMVMDETLETAESSSKTPPSYEERLIFLNPIAKPLAGKKLTKKIYKLIKKARKQPPSFFSGLKSVQQKLRKGGDGLVILAGDVHPIDVYSHLPGVCEEKNLPYCYVPSREDIGLAMGTRRGVITVFVAPHSDYSEAYDEVLSEIKAMPLPF